MPTLICAADRTALAILLRQPWQFERAPVVRWFLRALGPLAVLAPLVAMWRSGDVGTATIAAAVPLTILAFGCWIGFIGSLALQNTPVNAVLVPRARRLSLWLVPVLCLAMSGALAGVLALAFGHFAFFLAVFVLGMSGLGMMGNALHEGLLLFLLADFGITNAPHLMHTFDEAALSLPALLLALAVAVYAARRLFPRGGERHWKRQARNEVARAIVAGEAKAVSQLPGPGGISLRVYGAVLRRDCQDRKARAALLLHALGPAVHWSTWLSNGALIMAGLGAVLAVLKSPWVPVGASGLWSGMIAGGVIISASFMALLVEQAFGKRLAATVTEQGVLMLVPGMARGTALNRLLASRMLLHAALAVCAALGMSLCVGLAARIALEPLLAMMALATTSMVLVPAVLRDVAAMGNPLNIGRPFMLLLAMPALCGLYISLRIAFDLPWAWVIAFNLLLGGVLSYARWRAAVAAPQAFPAGRLA
ncbi:MAG: hypothetical protein V4463_01690 [Pseudomonadota bacterium]